GHKGMRVQAIVQELKGEKIDVVKWSSDPTEFIANALSPAKVLAVELFSEEKMARVVVPDYQLSLAIGKEGQNARLAAKLTGWKIDIKNESQDEENLEDKEGESEEELEEQEVEQELEVQEELE
ncbi:MAG TPA: transcription termination/antitermination protein NusA, partial [Clostridia bacterium]|nr:transcription termination/antitermination protein NusA [Clostridia bacterium]